MTPEPKRITQKVVDRTVIALAAREMTLEAIANEYDTLLRKKLGTDPKKVDARPTNDAEINDGDGNGIFKVK